MEPSYDLGLGMLLAAQIVGHTACVAEEDRVLLEGQIEQGAVRLLHLALSRDFPVKPGIEAELLPPNAPHTLNKQTPLLH